VTLERFDALPDKEIRALVCNSYEMVLVKLPKKVQAQLK
jgi:predicted DNA-binding protein (MmcQ/YjbR family)